MINVIFNKNIPDGWYMVQATKGIEYNKYRLDMPFKIESRLDNLIGNYSANFIMINDKFHKQSEQNIAIVLNCLGLWEKLSFAFPDKKLSVFNFNVVKYLKDQTVGRFCSIRISHNKLGFNIITAVAKPGLSESELEKDYKEMQEIMKNKLTELF